MRWSVGIASVALACLAPLLAHGCGEDVTLGCDPPPPECKGKPCGVSCAIDECAPLCETPCPKPGTCDGDGGCVATAPRCPMPDPCKGKTCGDGCMPVGMMPPMGMFQCDPAGACVHAPAMCPPPGPCAGKMCGEPCNPCMNVMLDGGCPPPPKLMACDEMHACVPAPAMCQ